jgi:hypothetical protein
MPTGSIANILPVCDMVGMAKYALPVIFKRRLLCRWHRICIEKRMAKNSVIVFIASAASVAFHMSVLYSRAHHPLRSFAEVQYDVADSREREAYRSRPVRERQQAALFHAKPVTQQQAESRESDQLQHKRATSQDFVQKKDIYLNALARILSDPFLGL